MRRRRGGGNTNIADSEGEPVVVHWTVTYDGGRPAAPIQITPGISARAPSPTGEVFFDHEFTVSVFGGYDLVVAGDWTGALTMSADDEMIATITRPDDAQVVHSHDVSNGCSGVVTGARVDLTPYVQVGPNIIRIVFKDKCGVSLGASAAWFVRTETLPLAAGHATAPQPPDTLTGSGQPSEPSPGPTTPAE